MAKATLTQRVEVLEHKVNELATLPARVGAVERELKEFRADVEAEFGRVHAEFDGVHSEFASVQTEFASVHTEFASVHTEFASVRAELASVHTELASVRAEFVSVRAEIREGDEETRRYMRVLYENLIERIKVMGEGIDELRRRP